MNSQFSPSLTLRVRYTIPMIFTFRFPIFLAALTLLVFALSGCRKAEVSNSIEYSNPPQTSNEVVLYCSVDEVYARPIINQLQRETGLRIRPLFDVEAAKTAGLASRLRTEKDRPRADVFWSSATLQTLLLSREGLLEQYAPPTANSLPSMWRAKDWVSTGVRCRVQVHNAREKQPPGVLEDFLLPRFKDNFGISNPLFGTGSDGAAALATRRGHDNTLNLFRRWKANGARVLPGNSVVAERVGRGELLAGVTDTDDFLALQKQFPELQISLPTNAKLPNDLIFVPMTAAIIKNAPHMSNAKKLMDALASAQTEALIVKAMPGVLPLRAPWNDVPPSIAPLKNYIASSRNDLEKWSDSWLQVRDPLSDILLRD